MRKASTAAAPGLNHYVSRCSSRVAGRYQVLDDAQTQGEAAGAWDGRRRSWDQEDAPPPAAQQELCESVAALNTLLDQGPAIPRTLLYQALKRCTAEKNLVLGRCVHALAVRSGHQSNTFLANHIIQMYAAHGKLAEATRVFDALPAPDTFTWYSMIRAHLEAGRPEEATAVYRRTRDARGVRPNRFVFVPALQAAGGAGDLAAGREVHADIVGSGGCGEGGEADVFVGNCLVDMYARCGSLADARRVFDGLEVRNAVSWNVMIGAYFRAGRSQEALELYDGMQREGVAEDVVTVGYVLKACGRVGGAGGGLQRGRRVHARVLELGLQGDVGVRNCLAGMYAKCGQVDDARAVFEGLVPADVETWNAMIRGYVQCGRAGEALALFARMQGQEEAGRGVMPDQVTFAAVLRACAGVGDLRRGKEVHAQVVARWGVVEVDAVLGSCLVDMYTKCGSVVEARAVFEALPSRNVVTWNTMITGYVKCGGMLEEARKLFDGMPARDAVSWAAMVAGYAQEGEGGEALALLARMQEEEGGEVTPTSQVTVVSLLQSCAAVGPSAVQYGRRVHAQAREQGMETAAAVGSCLVDMYAKCGSVGEAREVFDAVPMLRRDVVAWTAMIAGYVQAGRPGDALALYAAMQQEPQQVEPNEVTLVCVLQACGAAGAVAQGKQVHALARARGWDRGVVLANCLIDMYAKCGAMAAARAVFDALQDKTVVSWNALLNGYAQASDSGAAVQAFADMRAAGTPPDAATFVSLLVACSHGGMVREGQRWFQAMEPEFGVAPTPQHVACMVDLLARAGRLLEAEAMVLEQRQAAKDEAVCWKAVLSACKSHGDVDTALRCFDRLLDMAEPAAAAAAYALMTDVYEGAGRAADAARVRALRRAAGSQKVPARASVEVGGRVHWFDVGEERDDVAVKLRSVNLQLLRKSAGGQTRAAAAAEQEEEEEEVGLCGHAEKLALAYGLLNTPDGATLVVTKNLRMCGDCHRSTKLVSEVERREIVVRDAHRVHRFANGSCSCGDRH